MILQKQTHQNKIQASEDENQKALKRIQEKQLQQQKEASLCIAAIPSFYTQQHCVYHIDNAQGDEATKICNSNKVFPILPIPNHVTFLDTLYFMFNPKPF
jgi:hypothetical protein